MISKFIIKIGSIYAVGRSPAYLKRKHSVTFGTACLQYFVPQLVIENQNADDVLERIHTDSESGKPIHELELIFAPLMSSRFSIKKCSLIQSDWRN
jgi:hypothetical protein